MSKLPSSSRRSFLRSAFATTMLVPALAGRSLAADLSSLEASTATIGPDAMMLGRITLDRPVTNQEGALNGTLHFLRAVSGPIVVQWMDSFGRIAGEQQILATSPSGVAARFSFNMRPGLTYVNWIRVTVNGVSQAATAKFMLSPTWTPWDDYHAISWANYPDGYYDQLRDAGVDAIIAYTKSPNFSAVLNNNFHFYVEQMAWEVFAIYHKDEVEWRELLARVKQDRGNLELWVRSPCVNDPKTTEYLRKYLPQYVRRHRAYRPLFYNISDELGQGDQIQAQDFCHSKYCTAKFAEYLRARYGQPSAVQREWRTTMEMTHWDDSTLHAFPDWYKSQRSMISQTTTDRAFESIAWAWLSQKYKTIAEFNRQWGTTFPETRGDGPSNREAWGTVFAVVRDTLSAQDLNAASLEKLVGPLDQANTRWGSLAGWAAPNKPTQFKNWDEVAAFLKRFYKELGEVDSTRGWNVSPWCEFRNFMDTTFADAVHRAGEICKAEDPHALWATEGGQVPAAFGWYNYEKVVQAVDVIEPYTGGDNVEIIRSLNPSVKMLSTLSFSHTIGQPLTARDRILQKRRVREVWWDLVHAHNAAIIWDNNEPSVAFVDMKTGKPTAAAETFSAVFHEVRSGIGKLLLNARRKQDGIAIHYSQPTIQVEWLLTNVKHARDWMLLGPDTNSNLGYAVRNSWTKLIEDLGLQYNFIGSEGIGNGGLSSGKYKVFIMPKSVAVSPEEVEQIRAFVRSGGTLIADWRTAELNGLGRDLGNGGQLDDVFGIAHGAAGKASKTVQGVANEGSLHLTGQDLRTLSVGDPTVSLAGGKALAKSGDVPMVIVHPFGSGQAIFLNMEVADYGYHRLQANFQPVLPNLMESAFAMGGVKPRIRVLGPNGKRLPGVEIVRFANGGCEHVAIFRNPQTDNSGWGAYPKLLADESQVVLDPNLVEDIDNSLLEKDAEITIEWPENRETYDVRGQKTLGKLQTQKTTLHWWEPLVFTRSDNPLPAPKIAVAPSAKRGEMVEITLSSAGSLPDGTFRVVRLEFTTPSGKPYDLYARNAMFGSPSHVERIPFAVNDPAGNWKVTAHDLISGQTAEGSFRLA